MDGLVTFLEMVGVREVGIHWIAREVTGEAGERPDFVVRDGAGEECCIVEAKFWAGLTDNQPLMYLRRLAGREGTAVAFVCRPSRIDALWAELRVRCSQGNVGLAETHIRGGRAALTTLGPLLAVLSWEVLLTHLLQEAERQQDESAATDLRQVVGLADASTERHSHPSTPKTSAQTSPSGCSGTSRPSRTCTAA